MSVADSLFYLDLVSAFTSISLKKIWKKNKKKQIKKR